ncbi:MAG: sodium:solute symporter family protein [Flavobacteriia bacterium]
MAGRNLPFFMTSAALFATWFGSETILGASEEFIEHGVIGVIEEPIGAALCLILVGVFYAKRIYRTNALTFSDIFRDRFGKRAEIISALVMIPSFFTWIAAQFLALGLIFQLIFGLNLPTGILVGALLVVFYTALGGMWAVSVTDSIQMVVIIVGLLIVLGLFLTKTDLSIVSMKAGDDFFKLVNTDKLSMWEWGAAWITVGLGSIPSQDVFQRVISAKSEKIAIRASLTSGVLYLVIGLLPLLIGLVGSQLYPDFYQTHKGNFISAVILYKTPVWIQIVFFGALISAILSTASGAILAPSTILAENIARPYMIKMDLLKIMRYCVVLIAAFSVFLAFTSQSIFELVGLSSAFGLVSLFLPFTFAIFVRNTNSLAVILGMILGLLGWLIAEFVQVSVPSIFYGLLCSLIGLIVGIFLSTSEVKK